MASKPTINYKDVRRKLKNLGFVLKRSKKHETWDNGKGSIVQLSHGNDDVGPTLLKSICSQIGISIDVFLDI
ncbi:MAG: type II toxin-antitoxin system HicA family toxin [Spirochaetes bacterium]|nr:type II toxin-antitoxin system HicA family toxin [Spirochaetota bacterium]